MNLLNKGRKLIKPGLALLLIPVFFACRDLGNGLEFELDDQDIEVRDTTIILKASSIYIDSLRTDNQRLIFGQFQDPTFGFVRAIGYTSYGYNYNLDFPRDTLTYESAELVLHVTDTKSRDWLIGEELSIYQAGDTIYRSAVYLSDRFIEYDENNPVASITIDDFNPEVDSIINIPLDPGFGASIYERMVNATADTSALDSLNQIIFPPLVFVPGENNQGIFAVNPDSDTMAIYINLRAPDGSSHRREFSFVNRAVYSHVIRDRTGSEVASLNLPYQDSLSTGPYYLCNLSGIYTKIDLTPYLEFVDSRENFIVQHASLTLKDAEVSDPVYNPPVSSLSFYFIKEGGKINGPATLFASQYEHAALLTENSYGSTTVATILRVPYNNIQEHYQTEVTLFSQRLANERKNDFPVSTEEMVVMNTVTAGIRQTSFEDGGIKLRVIYTILK